MDKYPYPFGSRAKGSSSFALHYFRIAGVEQFYLGTASSGTENKHTYIHVVNGLPPSFARVWPRVISNAYTAVHCCMVAEQWQLQLSRR